MGKVAAGSGSVAGAITGLDPSGYTANTFGAGVNTSLTTNVAFNSSAATNSLYVGTASGALNNTSGSDSTLTISSGGVLIAPSVGPAQIGFNNQNNVSNFVHLSSGNALGDLIINQFDPNGVFLTGDFADNGSTAVSIVKNGPGTVIAWGNPGSNTGGTYINQGVLAVQTLLSSPPTGPWVTFSGNGSLQFFTSGGLIPSTGPVLGGKNVA